MTLAIRILPTLLYSQFGLVKGSAFDNWRRVGSAQQAINVHQLREVDEIAFLDIGADDSPDFELIDELSAECFVPLAVGGGIRSVDHAKRLLRSGADKVIVTEHSPLIGAIAAGFGCQAVCVAINVREGETDAVARALRAADSGAGEILLQSVPRDGTLQGYDLDTLAAVAAAVRVPVIASSGCGTAQHALEAVRAGADAIAIGAAFLFTELTPRAVKERLRENGYEVRL